MQKMFVRIFVFALIVININYAQVTEQWVQRFTSDSTRDETVNDMFVDAQGNVYVTGSQKGPFQAQLEAVTVKYNSQGVQQWIQNFHDPNNNGAVCRAIHVDALGNVYVTGDNGVNGPPYEMLVIKYNPAGTQLWFYRFKYNAAGVDRGYDVITDADGNVYVTGEFTGIANNVFLVKFDPNGALVNKTAYNQASEGGRKIGIDGAGKIIISGYINDNDSLSFLALKYEQNLDFVWAARWGFNVGNINPIDMVIDNNSNIIIAGSSNIDYATVKIDPAGTVMWGKLYNSPKGWDMCKAVVNDDLGNIYVTGQTGSNGFPLSFDMTTIKYNSDGDEIWVNKFDGDSAGTDGYSGYDIAIDNLANLYVVGSKHSTSEIATIKYNTEGEFQWSINYNGPSNSADNPVAIGVDPNGNVFSTGNSLDFTTGYDIAIIKYLQTPTSVEDEENSISSFTLEQNFPNPFNPTTKISWQSPVSSWQTLKVYDVLGNEIVTLVDEYKSAGNYKVDFNASGLVSGVYLYKLTAGNISETKKMLILK